MGSTNQLVRGYTPFTNHIITFFKKSHEILLVFLVITKHFKELEFTRNKDLSQPAFTYPKLTIEILEQGDNMLKVNNKDTRTMPLASFWCLYC